jgi:hypothetical protein
MTKAARRKSVGRKEARAVRKSGGKRLARSDRSAMTAPSGRTVAIETLRQQADRLGLLDPLDVEPAIVYVPDGGES